MKYWVIKGSARRSDWDSVLKPGKTGKRHAKVVPSDWAAGDRIFLWESRSFKRVIGLAELQNPSVPAPEEPWDDHWFRIRYLTKRLSYMPNIRELRKVPELRDTSFLQPHLSATVCRVTMSEGKKLFSILYQRNPDIKTVWLDFIGDEEEISLPDIDVSATEGRKQLVSHLRRERNQKLVAQKKKQVLAKHGTLACEICGFDFAKVYGTLGQGFCEAHHTEPLGMSEGEVETKLDDLSIVCSNCHRMLHRASDMATPAEMRNLINLVRDT